MKLLSLANHSFTRNRKPLIFLFVTLSLQGCSQFYGSQASQTNPYKVKPKPVVTIKPTVKPSQVKIKPLPSQAVISATTLPFPVAKKFIAKPLSPAVLALLTEADQNSQAGHLESAVATIERALRIDPRNPTLIYKLAILRLKQSKPRLAEDLAKKAALLSADDKSLKKRSWLLISEARKRQKKYHEAEEARLKADNI